MRNTVGVIAALSPAISKHNVKILSGLHDAPSSAENASWAFFADFMDGDIEPEALATELRSFPSVIEVRCRSSVDGFITDTMHFPHLLGSERAIIVRSVILESIIGRIKSMLGEESSSAKVILYQIGEASGQHVFDSVKAVIGVEFIRKNVARALSLFTALGWGILDLKAVDLNAKTAYIHIQHGFECESYTKSATAPQCHFVRGMLGGWFSRMFESKMDIVETECEAKGNSVCVFQVQPIKS
jgi:predicted hydrocarbon binding protein